MIGSSGENLHSPSTMNLYLHHSIITDEVHEGVAILKDDYDGGGELVALLFKCSGLLPLVEWPSEQYLIAAVAPGERLPYIRIFNIFFFDDCRIAFDFSKSDRFYPEEWIKLTVLSIPLLPLMEPFEFCPPIQLYIKSRRGNCTLEFLLDLFLNICWL